VRPTLGKVGHIDQGFVSSNLYSWMVGAHLVEIKSKILFSGKDMEKWGMLHEEAKFGLTPSKEMA